MMMMSGMREEGEIVRRRNILITFNTHNFHFRRQFFAAPLHPLVQRRRHVNWVGTLFNQCRVWKFTRNKFSSFLFNTQHGEREREWKFETQWRTDMRHFTLRNDMLWICFRCFVNCSIGMRLIGSGCFCVVEVQVLAAEQSCLERQKLIMIWAGNMPKSVYFYSFSAIWYVYLRAS